MIYITGDTHGTIDADKIYFEGKHLSSEDTIIICGDAGFIWGNDERDKIVIDKILSYTSAQILFVDGNHENFNRLNEYPIEQWCGGKTHFIRPRLRHLMRGEVFTLEEKTFFTLGGARSIDKQYRQENVSWWREELPSENTLSLIKEKYQPFISVDYILTHSAPSSFVYKMGFEGTDILTDFLEEIFMSAIFKGWFCGHYHRDILFNNSRFEKGFLQITYQNFYEIP